MYNKFSKQKNFLLKLKMQYITKLKLAVYGQIARQNVNNKLFYFDNIINKLS